jgi:hypothetical protein
VKILKKVTYFYIKGIKMAEKYNPLAISFNCIFIKEMNKILKRINLKDLKYPWGCYVNCGFEDFKKAFTNDEKGNKAEF